MVSIVPGNSCIPLAGGGGGEAVPGATHGYDVFTLSHAGTPGDLFLPCIPFGWGGGCVAPLAPLQCVLLKLLV